MEGSMEDDRRSGNKNLFSARIALYSLLFVVLLSVSGCYLNSSKVSTGDNSDSDGGQGSGSPTLDSLLPINESSSNAYTISGTCPKGASLVQLTSPFTQEMACSGGGFSEELDFSSLSDGNINVVIIGSEGQSVSVVVLKDTIPPTPPTNPIDGSYGASLTVSPVISWEASSDETSGVEKYQVRVLRASDSAVFSDWKDLTSGGIVTGLSLADGVGFKVEIRALDQVGNYSEPALTDGWLVDASAPSVVIAVSGAPSTLQQQSFTAAWSEAVTTFSGADINVTNGFVSSFSGSGASYTFSVIAYDPGAFTIKVSMGSVSDSAGNVNPVSNTLDQTFTVIGGLPDLAFGTSGSVDPGASYSMGSFLVESDNSLAVVDSSGTKIKRYTSLGVLDTNFGTGGEVDHSAFIPAASVATKSIRKQSNGKYIVSTVQASDITKVNTFRLTSSGALDATFGASGFHTIQPGGNCSNMMGAGAQLEVLGDDSIIVAVVCDSGSSKVSVFKLDPNGTLDTNFNGTGLQQKNVWSSALGRLLIQPDGKILTQTGGGMSKIQIWRFETNGVADTSFGTNGLLEYSGVALEIFSQFYQHSAMGLLSDGKIMVATINGGAIPNFRVSLYRFNSNGSLDTAFGTSGIYIDTYTSMSGPWSADLCVLSDNRVLVSIDKRSSVAAAYDLRSYYLNPPALSPYFGAGGVAPITEPAGSARIVPYGSNRVFVRTGASGVTRIWTTITFPGA